MVYTSYNVHINYIDHTSVPSQTLLQRMKEAEMFKEWESQEDEVRISHIQRVVQ